MKALPAIAAMLLAAALPAAAVESAFPGAAWLPPAEAELLQASRELQSFAVSRTFFERLASPETVRQVREWALSMQSYPRDNAVRLATLRGQLIADGIDPQTILSSKPAREGGRTIDHGLCVRIASEAGSGRDGVLVTAPVAPGSEENLASLFMTAHLMQAFRLQPKKPIYLCAVAGEGEGENFEGMRELLGLSGNGEKAERAVSASRHIALAGSGGTVWVNFLGTDTMVMQLAARAMPWSSSKSAEALKKAASELRDRIAGTGTAWEKDRTSPRSERRVSEVSCSGELLKEKCGFTISASSRSRMVLSDISEAAVGAAADAAAKAMIGESAAWKLEIPLHETSPATAMREEKNAAVRAWRAALGDSPAREDFISARFIRSGAALSSQAGLSAIAFGISPALKDRERAAAAARLKRLSLAALLLSGLDSDTAGVEAVGDRPGGFFAAKP